MQFVGENKNEEAMSDKQVQPSTSEGPAARPRSIYTAGKTKFNLSAPPFVSQKKLEQIKTEKALRTVDENTQNIPFARIGPTHLPVNSRIWSRIAAQPISAPEPSPVNEGPFQVSYGLQNSMDFDTGRQFGPIALLNGTIQVRLRDGIKVDMTIDKSVRVVNPRSSIVISMSGNSASAAMTHPNGQIFQHASLVDICAYDGHKRNNYIRLAKMWQKGVSLTSEGCALIYLVDSAGTRTCSDAIAFDMKRDYTIPVFLNSSRQGPHCFDEAAAIVNEASFWLNDDSSETFNINGFRVTQTVDGLVRVTRNNNKCIIRTSPNNGSANITTPFIHCTASLGQAGHMFVRCGEKRMHFDGTSFIVRNAGHSAGFDEINRLRVY